MSESPNPYQAPTATLPVPVRPSMPPALLATLACYLLHYVLDMLAFWKGTSGELGLFLPVAAISGTYCMAMCWALWRRWQWARMWLVMTTAISAFTLFNLAQRGWLRMEWLFALSSLLRIAVAAMLFLPPVRRWFAPRSA